MSQQGWWSADGTAALPEVTVAAVRRPYPQLLRGPAHRWWRPLVGLGIVVGVPLVLLTGSLVVAVIVTVALGDATALDYTDEQADRWLISPAGLLVTNLMLAAGIPLAQLAVWAGHRCRPGLLSCVVGRLRWRWLGGCLVVAGVVQLPLTVGLLALDPTATIAPEDQLLMLVVVVGLTTPLQAAGEEFFFRGWLSQAAASLVRRPAVAAVVGALVSAPLFALAHGAQSPWLFLDRLGFGLIASYLAWRTGGLEAPVAMHVVNNLIAFGGAIALGELDDALEITDVSAVLAVGDLVLLSVIAALIVWRARRRGVERLSP